MRLCLATLPREATMSDSDRSEPEGRLSIAITPMHRSEDGVWENGAREGASFFLLELVQADGEDAEIVLECRDERTAALAARAAAATMAAIGLGSPDGEIEAFDEDTAAILADNPTPELAPAAGEWRTAGDDEDDDAEEPDPVPRPS